MPDRSYNLLLLSDYLYVGGGTRALVNFARKLDTSRFVPTVAGVSGVSELLDIYASESFDVVICKSINELQELFSKKRFDCVLLNRSGDETEHTREILEFLCSLDNSVAVVERNIFGKPDFSAPAKRIDIHIHQSIDMLMRYLQRSNAEADDSILRNHVILPNPVDLARIDSHAVDHQERQKRRSDYGIGEDDIVVGHVCRPDIEKWDDAILYMLKRLEPGRKRVFYLAREVPESRKRKIERIMGSRCCLLSYSADENDVYHLLSCLDIYCHASRIGECCSNAIFEAMAFSLPVVTISTPDSKLCNGQIIQVDNGVTGFVGKNYQGYMLAVQRLVDSSGLRKAMGMAGRDLLTTGFDSGSLARQLEGVFLEAMTRRGRISSIQTAPDDGSGRGVCLDMTEYRKLCAQYQERLDNQIAVSGALSALESCFWFIWRKLRRIADKFEGKYTQELGD